MSTNKTQSPLWPFFYLVLLSSLFFALDYIPYDFGWDVLHDTSLVFGYLLGSTIWILMAIVINRSLNIFLWEGLFEKQGKSIPKLLRDMVASIIMLAAIGGIIGVLFKKDLTILLAATGGVGVVIGLALKELIADIFSGLAINIEGTFLLDDVIRVGDTEGTVVDINWRATHIKTTHNTIVIIPNSRISAAVVTNLSKDGTHVRSVFSLHLDYSVAPIDGLRILNAAVKHVQHVINTKENLILESDVVASNIDDVGVEYQVRYWLPDYLKLPVVRNQMIASIMEQLTRVGLYPSHPQQHIVHETHVSIEQTDADWRRALIVGTSFFADIEEEDIQYLAQSLEKRTYEAGEPVLRRGEQGTSMFFIQEGLVDVYIWLVSQNEERRVASMIAGSSFGEMSLLTGAPRSATIKAKTELLIFELGKEHVQKILQKRPSLAQSISSIIAQYRLRDQAVRDEHSKEQQIEQRATFAKQLLGKIQSFFQLS